MVKRINNIITAYFFFNRRAEKARRPKEAPLLLVSSCFYKYIELTIHNLVYMYIYMVKIYKETKWIKLI